MRVKMRVKIMDPYASFLLGFYLGSDHPDLSLDSLEIIFKETEKWQGSNQTAQSVPLNSIASTHQDLEKSPFAVIASTVLSHLSIK